MERYASKPFDAIVDAVTGVTFLLKAQVQPLPIAHRHTCLCVQETELRSYKVLAKTGCVPCCCCPPPARALLTSCACAAPTTTS